MTAKRYLFIDAYNVIHATEDLRRILNTDLDSACNRLTERVTAIHDAETIHTVLVFDSRNESLEVDHPLGKKTFECVYAPAGLSADGVIEQLVTRVAEPTHVTVASNDALVRESARASGAIAIGSKDLFDWIYACEQRLVQDAQRRSKTNEKEWRNGFEFDW